MLTPRTSARRSLWLLLPLLVLVFLLAPAPAAAETVWEVTTYGNGELLKSAFQGIALFGSENGGLYSAMKVAGLVALLAALFAALPSALGGQQALMAIPHVGITAGIVGILCSPSFHTTVAIVDRVALSTEMVSGVPFPIAVIGHASSFFGEQLAEKVEQAIYPVDFYGKFTESGLGWGPRVVQATMNVTLIDMQLATDLDAYIRLCLIPDVQSGHKTVDQVIKAKTAEEMLGDTNPAIPILLPSQCNSDGLPEDCTPPLEDQRCPEAFDRVINPRLGQATQDPQLLAVIGQSIGKTDPTQVLSAIDTTAQDVLGISQNARDLLKVRFAANQLLPSIQANAALAGQSGLLTAWSISAAEAQQTSSWITMGRMIQLVLPFFHATLEFLFYGFLLFGIPLTIVMPRIFPQVVGNALWLQLWPLAYVFANRILYMQAVKAGLYANQLDWGMSAASTQPILNTFNYAYAASGFPVAVGVLLLGGMIFGGSYAMTKVVQHGPWHTGAGMGVETAMGNVTAGSVNLDQRNAAPHTQMLTTDSMGHPMVEDILGDRRNPVSVTSIGQGMRNTTWGDGADAFRQNRSEDGFQLTTSPEGTYFSAPMASLQQFQSEAASHGSGYASARANTDRSTQGSSRNIGLAVNDLISRLQSDDVRKTHADSKGLTDTMTRSQSKHVGYALQQAYAHAESESVVRGLAAQDGVSFGLSAFGMGATSQLQVTATKNGQVVGSFSLNETQSRTFDNAYARAVANDHTLRDALTDGSTIAASHQQGYSFSDAANAISGVDHLQSEERSARDQWEHSSAASVTLSLSRESDIARLYWDKHYRDQHGNLDTARQSEQGRDAINTYFGEMRNLFLDPGKRGELGDLAKEALQNNPKGLETMKQIEQGLDAQRETLAGVQALPAPERPAAPVEHPPALDPLTLKGKTVQASALAGSTLVPSANPAPTTAVDHATQNPKGTKPHPVHPHGTDSARPRPAPGSGQPELDGDPGSAPGGHHVPSAAAMKSRQGLMREGMEKEPKTLGELKKDADVVQVQNLAAGILGQDDGHPPLWKRFLPSSWVGK